MPAQQIIGEQKELKINTNRATDNLITINRDNKNFKFLDLIFCIIKLLNMPFAKIKALALKTCFLIIGKL